MCVFVFICVYRVTVSGSYVVSPMQSHESMVVTVVRLLI